MNAPPDELPLGRLETGPVVLRRYTGDELGALIDAVASSLDHLQPWMPWASADPLETALAGFVERSVAEWRTGANFPYAIWDVNGPDLVGSTGLHPRLGPGLLEIGYWVRRSWARRGVASAAAGTLTEAAFSLSGIEAVHIHCDEANLASAAVARRIGYRLARVVDDEVSAPAETGRTMDWVMTRADWAGRRPSGS